MPSYTSFLHASLAGAALTGLTQAHGVLTHIQGIEGSPASVGFGVDPAISRNCSGISPCQLDTTLIREAEIENNVVNLCGRTQLLGNIDIALHTENAIAAGAVTQVQAGGELQITIHQVNADGAGPYACDVDEGSNASEFRDIEMITNVPGANGISQVETKDFVVTVKMPDDLRCFGSSNGNVCTVRCRNNAIAGPFGGCFPVEQVDVEPQVNSAKTIQTFKDTPGVLKQIEGNLRDLEANTKAMDKDQGAEAAANKAAGNALLSAADPIARTYPTIIPTVVSAPVPAGADPASGGPVAAEPTAAPEETEAASTTSAATRTRGRGRGRAGRSSSTAAATATAASGRTRKVRRAQQFYV